MHVCVYVCVCVSLCVSLCVCVCVCVLWCEAPPPLSTSSSQLCGAMQVPILEGQPLKGSTPMAGILRKEAETDREVRGLCTLCLPGHLSASASFLIIAMTCCCGSCYCPCHVGPITAPAMWALLLPLPCGPCYCPCQLTAYRAVGWAT